MIKKVAIVEDEALISHHQPLRRQEEALEQVLMDATASTDDWPEKIEILAQGLQLSVPFDFMNVYLGEHEPPPANAILLSRVGYNRYKFFSSHDLERLTGLEASQIRRIATGAIFSPGIFNDNDFEKQSDRCPLKKLLQKILQIGSCLLFPVVTSTGKVVHFTFYSRKANGYMTEHQKLLSLVHVQLGTLAEQLIDIKGSHRNGSSTIPIAGINQPIMPLSHLPDIIGNSPSILEVKDNIVLSAPLDTSVLILGESGTGKERVAKGIHHLSSRKDRPLVIINCAALPANLIESELFGHQKGAFTGAVETRKGKFEAADKGTIFLDEIGEMPMEMQVRLLRVLQEREIERIGSNELMKIDVRVIAATSRDLEQEVRRGNFRLDLYYRLCVFPIVVPALRHRLGDILLLAHHFIDKFATKFNKKIIGLSQEAKRILLDYAWPGNVRELENTIERTVLRNTGPVIEHIPIFTSHPGPLHSSDDDSPAKTIDARNREFIRQTLQRCRGKIGGPGGAAEVLGIPATTLHSKMKKLGLNSRNW